MCGGAGRELGFCSDAQFHRMRALLRSLPGLSRIVPTRARRKLVRQLAAGDSALLPLFALRFDVGDRRVSLRVEPRPAGEGAVVAGAVE